MGGHDRSCRRLAGARRSPRRRRRPFPGRDRRRVCRRHPWPRRRRPHRRVAQPDHRRALGRQGRHGLGRPACGCPARDTRRPSRDQRGRTQRPSVHSGQWRVGSAGATAQGTGEPKHPSAGPPRAGRLRLALPPRRRDRRRSPAGSGADHAARRRDRVPLHRYRNPGVRHRTHPRLLVPQSPQHRAVPPHDREPDPGQHRVHRTQPAPGAHGPHRGDSAGIGHSGRGHRHPPPRRRHAHPPARLRRRSVDSWSAGRLDGRVRWLRRTADSAAELPVPAHPPLVRRRVRAIRRGPHGARTQAPRDGLGGDAGRPVRPGSPPHGRGLGVRGSRAGECRGHIPGSGADFGGRGGYVRRVGQGHRRGAAADRGLRPPHADGAGAAS